MIALDTILDVIGNHRGFGQNDAFAFDIDQRVRGAEIDGHVGRKEAGKSA